MQQTVVIGTWDEHFVSGSHNIKNVSVSLRKNFFKNNSYIYEINHIIHSPVMSICTKNKQTNKQTQNKTNKIEQNITLLLFKATFYALLHWTENPQQGSTKKLFWLIYFVYVMVLYLWTLSTRILFISAIDKISLTKRQTSKGWGFVK